MDKKLINKICLGTAQFGLDYGIANVKGKIAKAEVFEVLDYAHNLGISTLDTAFDYGESEDVIGAFSEKNQSSFRVISKLAATNNFDKAKIEEAFRKTLLRLKLKRVHGYLIHNFADFLKFEGLWDILQDLKKRGLIDKIGFSIYKPQELEIILDRKLDFDIIQFPYSIFDRRFSGYFKLLRERKAEVFVRSVFLQGLVFLKPEDLEGNLKKAIPYSKKLRELAIQSGISIEALCLNFALLNPCIDKVIVGIDGIGHLKANVENTGYSEEVKAIYDKLDLFAIDDEDIVLPYRWSKK